MTTKALQIAGIQPLSTVDWPGKLAAVLFLQGCPWRCPYCHNFEILDPQTPGQRSWQEVQELLERRHGLLDGVVFSGGEATRQPGVLDAAAEVKEGGYQVGLHTAGAYPGALARLLDAKVIDWVGLDIKALPQDYAAAAGSGAAAAKAARALDILLATDTDYEVRLTLWRGGLEYAAEVAQWCKDRGVKNFVLQRLQDQNLPDAYSVDAPSVGWTRAQALAALEPVGLENVDVRGAA